jgi:DNA primase
MKTLSQEKIIEIRNSVNIVDVVSNYISLTKRGKNYFGVCPFHEDSDPSLSVSEEKQIFSCFSCHTAGNVFNFIMEYEHVSFIEAVKMVASISGIDVSIDVPSKTNFKEKPLYDIYELSHKLYLNNINTEYGKLPLQYLHNRGFTDDMIKEFEIGLAIKSNNTLSNLLLKKDFNESDLIKSTLIVKDDRGFHDFFYDRIMFPLHDMNNKVIGYSGRVYYDSTGPKYINSKEHPLFKKGEFLYNYYRAKNECRMKNTVILMEGFMDVIRAYSVGVKNVVATLGTAFTKNHAMLIRKLASNVIICYDGDTAGAKATFACSNELLKLGITPKIVRLEDNLDPDEYVLKYGKDKFLDKINNPISVMDFKLNFLKNKKDLTQTVDRANYAKEALEEINKIDDEILKEVSLKKLSVETSLDIEYLKSWLKDKEEKIPVIEKPKIKTSVYEKAEYGLLYYMLKDKNVVKIFDSKMIYFPDKECRELYNEIKCFINDFGYINEADFLSYIDDTLNKIVGNILTLDYKEEYSENMVADFIKTIQEKNITDQCNRLKREMENTQDIDKKIEISQRIVDIMVRREENGE